MYVYRHSSCNISTFRRTYCKIKRGIYETIVIETVGDRTMTQKQHSKNLGLVWVFFAYYWVVFGIATYFGQYLPEQYRPQASFVILVIILMSLMVQGFNRSGKIISHIFTIFLGLVSYGTFELFIERFDASVFYSIIILAVSMFLIFGIMGYYVFNDVSHWGRFLFVGMIMYLFAVAINWFLNIEALSFIVVTSGIVLYCFITVYDFNKMKTRKYKSARVMGFSLFINLIFILRRLLRLYRLVNRRS